jgi:hypothetical protein
VSLECVNWKMVNEIFNILTSNNSRSGLRA